MRPATIVAALCAAFAIGAGASCITPQWVEKTPSVYAGQMMSNIVQTADLNGDGIAEVVGNTATSLAYAALNADGTVGLPQPILSDARYINGLVLADFNHDTKIDVLVSDRDAKTLLFLPGNGDATFGSPVVSAVPEFPHVLATGDFDRDGNLDAVVAANDINKLIIYKGDGAGHFVESSRADVEPASLRVAIGDLDGDGVPDIVVSHEFSDIIDVLFGKGDASFAASLKITGRNYAAAAAVADLDGDGDLDLIFANAWDLTVSVHINFGGRTFGPPALFRATPPSGTNTWSNPFDMAVTDVTGDGRLDVVVSTTGGYVLTFDGNGVGGFADATAYVLSPKARASIALADIDADGRIDLVLGKAVSIPTTILRNRCGDSRVTLSSSPPTVSVGQTFTAIVKVVGMSTSSSRIATGRVDLRSGETVLATGLLANGTITFNVSDAPPADHSLVAFYLGDVEYTPNQSAEVLQRVTTTTTTTTVASSKSDYEYGEQVIVTARATTSEGSAVTGTFYFIVDSVESSYSYGTGTGITATYYGYPNTGTHSYSARYAGDATHPPSPASAPLQINVFKSTPTLSFSYPPRTVTAGTATTYEVWINRKYSNGAYPTGTLTLFDGATQLQSITLTGSSYVYFQLTGLTPGVHQLHVEYGGNSNYNAATSTIVQTIAYPAGQASFDARGEATGIRLYWSPNVSTRTTYRAPSPYTIWSTTYVYNGELDVNVSPGIVYVYEFHSSDGYTTFPAIRDLAQFISFTDDPVTPGIAIKAVHMTEIVDGLNKVRVAAGLPAISFVVSPGDVIKAQDILSLRAAIVEARQKLNVYPVTFTNAVAPGAPIRAVDIQELRDAIR